jgi:hypothetical protein
MAENLPKAEIACPICEGTMEVVYQRHGQTVLVCVDCQTAITISASAADTIKRKREGTWTPRKP